MQSDTHARPLEFESPQTPQIKTLLHGYGSDFHCLISCMCARNWTATGMSPLLMERPSAAGSGMPFRLSFSFMVSVVPGLPPSGVVPLNGARLATFLSPVNRLSRQECRDSITPKSPRPVTSSRPSDTVGAALDKRGFPGAWQSGMDRVVAKAVDRAVGARAVACGVPFAGPGVRAAALVYRRPCKPTVPAWSQFPPQKREHGCIR